MTKAKTLTLKEFDENARGDLEKKIADMISDKQIVNILSGGKRLRPLLAHLTFKACTKGNETSHEYQRALEGGVVIELAHTASLVHDDIIDDDVKRRGKTSFHVKKGIANAILTGHKMLSTGFNIALRHGQDFAKLYVDSWEEVVNGEIDEVKFNTKDAKKLNEFSLKSQIFKAYEKIIDFKTAALFSSACQAGALEANMSGDILKVFSSYGREIGLAYQLADDLVDLANGEMIDSVIIPLLNKIENQTSNKLKLFEKREIKRKFKRNKEKIKQFYIDEIRKHVEKAEELSKSELIPQSQFKDLLVDAPSYIINRMLNEINVTI
jgi:geranylgeranyl pyrophosphate synthase